MDDDRFFEMVDMLDGGATNRPHHQQGYGLFSGGADGSAHDQYLPSDANDQAWPLLYNNGPNVLPDSVQFDSFDERLLNQPDIDSRHAQAVLGRARLSLPMRDHISQPQFDADMNSRDLPHSMPRLEASRPRFTAGHPTPSMSSSHRQSSPTSRLSQSSTALDSQTHERRLVDDELVSPQSAQSAPQKVGSDEHLRSDSFGDHITSRLAPWPGTPQQTTSQTPVVQGINLVSTRSLPDRFRAIFPFPFFNAVQSKCFGVVYRSNDNFVVSAPTGSGKTAVLELAICRLMNGSPDGSYKIVYQAPTKSLCSERQRDWQTKFGPLGLQCAEMTGDTDHIQLRDIKYASIIVTTPEKWDSVTRKWKDHQKLIETVKLFLIDEVHILKEDRGATLEAVVSRMKSVGSNVRFVALSATVPNSQDIATWLGKDPVTEQVPAPREKFGEEFRPVRLQKHVCGYQSKGNDFAFEHILNSRLTDVISKWSQRKPIMVFCITRKACVDTAKLLANWWSAKGPRERYWSPPQKHILIADQQLKDTITAGVAFHHAGLTVEDRAAVEQGYLSGDINVICCTSTLAVGVNLPCHMVIIKNTVTYVGSGIKEYSDLEVTQMLGRAGRPQFDDSAVAVIMTRIQHVKFYEQLMSGQEILESCLHKHLTEHLNSEIGLGTIKDLAAAKRWLKGTFLYVRLRENPQHYHISDHTPGYDIDECLENICRLAITSLEEYDLIKGTSSVMSTELGEAMARYYVRFDTMKSLLALPDQVKVSEILSVVAQAAEYKDIRFRGGEKSVYRELNKHGSIRFPIAVNVDSNAHKVSLIIQASLAGIELPTEDNRHQFEFMKCKKAIFQHANRLIRCIVDCLLYVKDPTSVRNALMLARSFGAHVWDDSPLQMTQLDDLGIVRARKLVAAGIKSIEDLGNADPRRIEAILSRNPPYGSRLQEHAMDFPRLRISMAMAGKPVVKKDQCVAISVKAEIGFLNDRVPKKFGRRLVFVCILAETSDGHLAHFARISAEKLNKGQEVLFTAELKMPGQTIRGFVMCDEFAGTQTSATLKPEIPDFMFPTPKALEGEARNQAGATNVSKAMKRHTAYGAHSHRSPSGINEFEDAMLDDATLAAAEDDVFHNIDDYDEDGKIATSKKTPSISNTTVQGIEIRRPEQLPNGRWACNHRCDKTKCKHQCCRHGLEKLPRPPKAKEAMKDDPTSDPKQRKLDLQSMKTMKPSAVIAASSGSATPSMIHKKTDSQHTRDLGRLHNSVKSSVSSLPLFTGTANSEDKPKSAAFVESHIRSSSSKKAQQTQEDTIRCLHNSEFPVDVMGTKPATPIGPSIHDLCASDDMLDDLFTLPKDTAVANEPSIAYSVRASPSGDVESKNAEQELPVREAQLLTTHGPIISNDAGDKCSTDAGATGCSANMLKRPRENYQEKGLLSPPSKKRSESHVQKLGDDMLHDEAHVEASVAASTEMRDRSMLGIGRDAMQDGHGLLDPAKNGEDTRGLSLQEWFENEFGTEMFTFTG